MLIRADARALPLRDRCVSCVVTSPPYFGLRDYGTATWTGGDPDCAHAGRVLLSAAPGTPKQNSNRGSANVRSGDCGKCGAKRVDAQIGLEDSPAEYIDTIVGVFREVWRVLKDDGTAWLNLGDSYASASKGSGGPSAKQLSNAGSRYAVVRFNHGAKEKDLLGVPWRVALALQADGWYLRSDIIWSKPNPMPESVTDRPTKAHEYLFLLSKSERYYYDARAIAETSVTEWMIDAQKRRQRVLATGGAISGGTGETISAGTTRNKRSVWTVNTHPHAYTGAHFATMPEPLIEPCILAGSPLGGLVFDPFVGSGTVIAVAQRLGRLGVGVDLNYQQLASERTAQRGLVFAESEVVP